MPSDENQNLTPTSANAEAPVSVAPAQSNSSSPPPNAIRYGPNNSPTTKSHKKLFTLLGVLILVGILFSVAYYFKHRNTATANPTVSLKSVSSSFTTANDNFGVNVFSQLVKQSPQTNVLISPVGIAMALSMVYNGANGSTQTAMQKVLNYQGLSLNTINNSSSALVTGLKNSDPEVTLSIANSIWLKKSFKVNQSFLNTAQKDYRAKATTLDFNSPSAPNTINNWVRNATDGKIPTIVQNIPSSEIMYLINAVYFKGAWHTKFDPSQTRSYPFTTGSSSTVQAKLMTQTGTYNYYSDNSIQAIQLPYGKNQRITMNVYLPTNITTFLQNISYAQLASIDSKYTQQQGTVLLPKFTLSYSQNLNGTLKALGMGVALNPYGAANFNGIAKKIHISELKHKAYIDVNEQGTTAAAATSVGLISNAVAGPSSGFYMEVDKPFVLTIQDKLTNEVLFVGAIQNPGQ